MKRRSMILLAAIALSAGLAGFAATGCQNLDVGTVIAPSDSSVDDGLDDPGANLTPLEGSSLELER